MSMVLISGGLQFPLWYSSLKRIEMRTNGCLIEDGFVVINNDSHFY